MLIDRTFHNCLSCDYPMDLTGTLGDYCDNCGWSQTSLIQGRTYVYEESMIPKRYYNRTKCAPSNLPDLPKKKTFFQRVLEKLR